MSSSKSLMKLSSLPTSGNRVRVEGIPNVSRFCFLTKAEQAILLAQKHGDTIEEMAVNLDLPIRAVKIIRNALFGKLGVTTRQAALCRAEACGVLARD